MKTIYKVLIAWAAAILFVSILTYALCEAHVVFPPPTKKIILTVKPGNGVRQIVAQLQASSANVFLLQWLVAAHLLGNQFHLQAGRYQIYNGETVLQILRRLEKGDVLLSVFTIVPGETVSQLRSALNAQRDIRHDTLTLSDEQILQALHVGGRFAMAGLFMPDTYLYATGTPDLIILVRAMNKMHHFLTQQWPMRGANTCVDSAYEALILASLIEKETALPLDKEYVASVFCNRLHRRMPLQTDPSVLYGMIDHHVIRKSDLHNHHPYNTYTHKGLPPAPICFPSPESILVALHPVQSDYLFFVASGDGKTVFSRTFSEHLKAIHRYIH